MKKILLILSLVFIVTACSTVNTPENNKTQVKRLLKEAEKKEKAAEKERIEESKKIEEENVKEVEIEKNSKIKEESSEIVEEVKKEKWVNPHEGKTRGEIMQYEMERVRAEMEALQTSVDDYAKRTKMLKEYKEKLEKLEKLNKASMQ